MAHSIVILKLMVHFTHFKLTLYIYIYIHDLSHPVILGRDFLSVFALSLNFPNSSLHLRSSPLTPLPSRPSLQQSFFVLPSLSMKVFLFCLPGLKQSFPLKFPQMFLPAPLVSLILRPNVRTNIFFRELIS